MRSFSITAYLTSLTSREVVETIVQRVREEDVGTVVENIMRSYGHLVASLVVVPAEKA
jgi:hypothetical protein